ncbi:hypothetical protein X907_0892 [Glycocaulis alkaliphilus]|uniref:Uncharacterized protein n=1 Tax=Glycocaulis alkaliphilus TaxID=1434191 RepID=A0A3T0E7S7_9PROT|nr:hypothetical protein X907_0892 [Glycocaulis alkaliphilus]
MRLNGRFGHHHAERHARERIDKTNNDMELFAFHSTALPVK